MGTNELDKFTIGLEMQKIANAFSAGLESLEKSDPEMAAKIIELMNKKDIEGLKKLQQEIKDKAKQ